MIEQQPVTPTPNLETADIETSSAGYAARFAGATGAWMLAVQERGTLAMLPPPERTTILDVGGGHGQLAIPLCQRGYAVTVLGSAESCRQRVIEAEKSGRCRFVTGNILDLPFPDGAFDTVISFRLMTHCTAWPTLIRELCRVARRSVIVDYPVNGGLHALAPALFEAKKKLEGNTRTWRPFRREEVDREFRKHDFVPDGRTPQFFLPIVLHRLLRCRGLSAALEGVCRSLGLTRRWGSPVIVRMKRAVLLVAACCLFPAAVAWSDTSVGDWGHFLSNKAKVCLNNPEGKAFSVTVHMMRWPMGKWNPEKVKMVLTSPDGQSIATGDGELQEAEYNLNVPAGLKGVYRLQAEGFLWVSSSLDESVVWTGDPAKRHVFRERFAPVFQVVVPRRWWFWVPEGTTRFTCKAQRPSEYMSQREDWGIFIISPRGQRVRALWGQPPITPPAEYLQDMTAEVEVEPGASGRFWSMEMRFGDSHNYSKPNICFDGIPPYISRSPEEWFDPETGRKPAVKVYDDDPFIQSARIDPFMKQHWPNLQHFSPCPSLGDPDGVMILGDATFALWNPADRPLGFRIGTYLPRDAGGVPQMAQVSITGPAGGSVFEKKLPVVHIHEGNGHPTDSIKTGRGVSMVTVQGADRWLSFTYPATPLVLMAKESTNGWKSFRFTAGTARNWYFLVPEGTREFSVRAAADDPEDVMHLEVCAPDRTMALIYNRTGESIIRVPAGLDGKIWHLRPDVGSATRMITKDGPNYRYQEMRLMVELKGVPGCLAPTWEQWFDPVKPVPAVDRARR